MRLDAAFFTRATAVMRNRGYVLDRGDLETDRLQGTDCGFAAGPGTFDADFDFAHAVSHGLAGGILGDLLRRISRAFARALETDAAGTGPADQVALHVSDGDLGVIESREDVGHAHRHVFGVLGLDDLPGVGVLTQQLSSGWCGHGG